MKAKILTDFQICISVPLRNIFMKQLFGNKAKGRISKRVFQENKARQIFRKTNISYSLIRTLCLLETPVLRFEIRNKTMIKIRCSTQ